MIDIGKALILMGLVLLIFGGLFLLFQRFTFHLPGDILIKRKQVVFYFPLATSILISIILTLVFNIIFRIKR